MKMTDQQIREFEELTRPVIEWLNANCPQRIAVVIEPTSASLCEGLITYSTTEYLRGEDT